MLRILTFLIVIAVTQVVFSDNKIRKLDIDQTLESVLKEHDEQKEKIDNRQSNREIILNNLDGKARDDYIRYLVDHSKQLDVFNYESKNNVDVFNMSVFKWQRYSTKIIFWTVILLVALGALFSIVQFYKSYKIVSRNETELSISDKGFTIKTSVLGVVILGLSLAFFYFYIAFVYPISVHSLN